MPYVVGPFSEAHLLVQWGGSLPGNERWSCSFRLKAPAGGPYQADAILNTAAYSSAIQAFHVAAASKIYNLCKMDFIKVNVITPDGLYSSPTTNELAITPVAGGGSTVAYPNQIALVATLETGFTRGPAHRGRFYLPTPSMAMGSDGRISVVDRDSVKASVDQMRVAVNAVSGYKMAVFSRKAGAAASRACTSITVGRVLDTQRRRRRNLVEAYI